MSRLLSIASRTLVFLGAIVSAATADAAAPVRDRTVVLLHGLARSTSSMDRMAASLEEAGYRVCNVAYPSRKYSVATLAAEHVAPEIPKCIVDPKAPLDFVTHSLGGIVVRQLV